MICQLAGWEAVGDSLSAHFLDYNTLNADESKVLFEYITIVPQSKEPEFHDFFAIALDGDWPYDQSLRRSTRSVCYCT